MKHIKPYIQRLLLAGILCFCGPLSAWGQTPDIPPQYVIEYPLVSEVQSAAGTETESFILDVVQVEDAPWLRLHFGDCNLGNKSYILLTSEEDGEQQRLDQRALGWWNYSSAFFNGDTVIVELYVAPSDGDVFVTLQAVTVGEREASQPGGEGIESICGATDDRVATNDYRVGRISGCSAWLVSNGAVLTAGHCTDVDYDDCGTDHPDGVLDLGGVFEVNVPDSDSDGTTNMAAVADQFPIDTSNVTWRFDGECQGIGKDWSVFGLNPNSNEQRAHILHGFFRMSRENPVANNTIRVTGYGVDDQPLGTTGWRNAQNRTEQTHTGPYVMEEFQNPPTNTDISHRYQVDTRGASSGSPIIWNSNGWTIGIHTNGGCEADGTGSNSGTSFEVDALEIAIRDWPTTFAGQDVEYVDWAGIPSSPTRNGAIFRPRATVTDGVNNVANNGIISIVEGNYTKAAGNTFTAGADGKAMTLLAPVGTVTIGN